MILISLPCFHSFFHNACPRYLKSRRDLLYEDASKNDGLLKKEYFRITVNIFHLVLTCSSYSNWLRILIPCQDKHQLGTRIEYWLHHLDGQWTDRTSSPYEWDHRWLHDILIYVGMLTKSIKLILKYLWKQFLNVVSK